MATEDTREQKLLELIRQGLALSTARTSAQTLGDRSQYIGMSDIGAYLNCQRAAVLKKLDASNYEADLSSLITRTRGHWFEDGIASALRELNIPHVQQLEISIWHDDTPVKAHLDFVLVSTHSKPTVRILEIKSCQKIPDVLYPSYEMQVYGQIGLLHRHWDGPDFNYTDEKGVWRFGGQTFPEAAQSLWDIDLPDDVTFVDIEAWVLCLSMTDAKVFGPYTADYNILDMGLDAADKLWRSTKLVRNGAVDMTSIPVPSGFNPMCNHCEWNSDCPKFGNQNCPELQPLLEDLVQQKKEKERLENSIRQHEQYLRDWYANSDAQGGWIEAGNHRFRLADIMGRKRLNKESLMSELAEIFATEDMDDIDIPALIARHERVGEPSKRLFINQINN